MAGLSGSAFAQGLLMGAGDAGQKYFEDMRRNRFDNMKMEKTFNMFKKQTDYSTAVQAEKEKGVALYKAGLANIGDLNTQRKEWERVSKMDVGQIVYQNAIKASEKFSKDDRPAFIRDYMKRKNGISKAQAINDRGLTLSDYSQYKGKEEYADAIPKQYLAGVPELPDADSLFTYDPQAEFMQGVQANAEKLTDYDKKKRDALGVIKDSTLVTFQAEPSQEVAEFLWLKRPDGKDTVMKGADVISQDNTRLASMIQSGKIVKIGGQLKFKHELDEDERELLGMPPKASVVTTSPSPKGQKTDVGYEYQEPTTAAYLEEQKAEKAEKALDTQVKAMGKELVAGKGSPLTTHTELSEAVNTLDAMDDGVLKYLFTAGLSTETYRDIAAKFGSEEAQKAKDLIAKMSGSVNAIRHELFGSALTEGEAEKFREQFSDIGAFNNKENLRGQLMNLINKAELGVAEKTAGYDTDVRAEFLKRNPQYAGVFSQVNLGDTEDTPRPVSMGEALTQAQAEAETTAAPAVSPETPKETAQITIPAATQASLEKWVDASIAAGTYPESAREQLTKFMMDKVKAEMANQQ